MTRCSIKRISLMVRPSEIKGSGKVARRLEVVIIREKGRRYIIRPYSFDRLVRELKPFKCVPYLSKSGGRYPGSMWMSWKIRE